MFNFAMLNRFKNSEPHIQTIKINKYKLTKIQTTLSINFKMKLKLWNNKLNQMECIPILTSITRFQLQSKTSDNRID